MMCHKQQCKCWTSYPHILVFIDSDQCTEEKSKSELFSFFDINSEYLDEKVIKLIAKCVSHSTMYKQLQFIPLLVSSTSLEYKPPAMYLKHIRKIISRYYIVRVWQNNVDFIYICKYFLNSLDRIDGFGLNTRQNNTTPKHL